MLRLVRKMGKFIRGGAGPLQIFMACLLGMLLGFVPGFNMTTVVLIVLVLILNVSLGVTILSFAVGRILALILAPLTFQLGYVIIHRIGLEGFFRAAGDTPVVAMMNLHFYCLAGGIPVAIVLGAVAGIGLSKLIVAIRKGLVAASGKSRLVEVLFSNPVTRLLMFILFGRSKKSMKEMLEGKSPLIRKSGVIVSAALVLIVGGGSVLLVDVLLASQMADAMGKANGAEVNIEEANLSLTQGRLEIVGLQVTDRDNPTENLVQAKRIVSDMSIADLLAKRVVIERIEVSDLRSNAPRETPGDVYPIEVKPEPPAEEDQKWPGEVIWDYFENPEKYQKYLQYLRKLKEYLEKQRQREKEEPDKDWLVEQAKNKGYFALNARHILTKHPTVVIRELVVDEIRVPQFEKDVLRLEGKELSSHPGLNAGQMSVHLMNLPRTPEEQPGQYQHVYADFGFHTDRQIHKLDYLLSGIDIGEDVQFSDRVPIKFKSAEAFLNGKGGFNYEQFDVRTAIRVRLVDGEPREDQGMLGLAVDDTKMVLQAVSDLNLAVEVTGPIERPRIRVDEAATLRNIGDSLKALGKTRLAKTVGNVASEVGKGLKEGAGKLIEGTGDLFKGIDQAVRGEPDANDTDGGDKKPGLLDGLLGSGKEDPNAKDPPKEQEDPNANDKKPGLLEGILGG